MVMTRSIDWSSPVATLCANAEVVEKVASIHINGDFVEFHET